MMTTTECGGLVDIVCLSAKQGGGKDTAFKQLHALIERKYPNKEDFDWRVVRAAFADPIRKIASLVRDDFAADGFPPPPGFETKDGDLMQRIGQWARTRYGNDVWIKKCLRHMERLVKENGQADRLTICITDCRYRNEFDFFPQALRVRLEAPEHVRKSRAENWRDNTTHESEIDLDGYAAEGKFDAYIDTSVIAAPTVAESIYVDLIHGWDRKSELVRSTKMETV